MRTALFALALLPANVPGQPAPSPPPQTPEPSTRAPAPPPENRAKPLCNYVHRIPAVLRGGGPLRARPLRDEPAANLYLGVLRYEGGCEKPVMIRQDVRDFRLRR